MTDHHQELAKLAVDRFISTISDEAREYITEAQLNDLEQLICQLLSQERSHIADLMEAFTKTLRSGVEKPELSL